MAHSERVAEPDSLRRTEVLDRPRLRLIVRLETDGLFESLLIAAVATILVTRASLQAAGYPQVGGGGLHIAHMLWGGLLMLAALVLVTATVGTPARRIGAVVGGIGFGLFIDELGKFITSDNNYFFQPTVGLLYVIFVILFLLFRVLDTYQPRSRLERLTNLADALPDLVFRDAPGLHRRATELLEQAAPHDELTAALRRVLVVTRPSRVDELDPRSPRARAFAAYERFRESPWFRRGITLLFIGNALLNFVVVAVLLLVIGALAFAGAMPLALAELAAEAEGESWIAIGIIALGSVIALACTLVGMWHIRKSRLDALRWYQRSVVVSLLLVQPINFFTDSFGGLTGLAVNLILWLGLGYLIHQEGSRRGRLAPAPATAYRSEA